MAEVIVHSARSFLDPRNLLPVVINWTFFLCVQIAFFWFVASDALRDALVRPAGFIAEFIKRQPVLLAAVRDRLDDKASREAVNAAAAEAKARRDEKNRALVVKTFTPVLVGLVIMLIVLLFLMGLRRERFGLIDVVLLMTVLTAFTTELVFYLIVLRNYVYLGDMGLMSALFPSSDPIEELPEVPELPGP